MNYRFITFLLVCFTSLLMTAFFLVWFIPQENFGGNKIIMEKPILDLAEVGVEKTSIESIQSAKILKSIKYKQIKPYTVNDQTYEVHEYVDPKGNPGYYILIRKEDYIKSIGYGSLADRFTYEYKLLEEDL